jgi:hypothetical protein
MLFQSCVIWALGLAATVIGTVANLRFNGPGAAALFLGIMVVMIYFLTYQISCLIHGKCWSTSWLNTLLYLVTIGGVLWYYYVAFRNGALPSLSRQDLFTLSTSFQTTRDLVKKQYNVDISDYIDKIQNN